MIKLRPEWVHEPVHHAQSGAPYPRVSLSVCQASRLRAAGTRLSVGEVRAVRKVYRGVDVVWAAVVTCAGVCTAAVGARVGPGEVDIAEVHEEAGDEDRGERLFEGSDKVRLRGDPDDDLEDVEYQENHEVDRPVAEEQLQEGRLDVRSCSRLPEPVRPPPRHSDDERVRHDEAYPRCRCPYKPYRSVTPGVTALAATRASWPL
ncbi:hypothetical protein C8Q73DRAFT_687082 [Cubamyces lactineus]|nr:hypothetical protein C8Q73DRAFT_687082 [Cubamyces lactineus]